MLFEIWTAFILSFFILFPAYAANCFPVFSKFLKKRHPIDGGRNLGKHRILGDGKTWEGFAIGMTAGFTVGAIETYLQPLLNGYANQFGATLPTMNLFVAFMIPLGVLTADAVASFFKRRLGMKRGHDAPFLDQLNLVVGAVAFSYFFTEITFTMIIIMMITTLIVHRTVSIIGYRLKLKNEPW